MALHGALWYNSGYARIYNTDPTNLYMDVSCTVCLHEAAQAIVANQCGDRTARLLGRMSLNPIRHIDLAGTIIIPLVIGMMTQFSFVVGHAI